MSHPLPDLDALLAHGDFVRALARSLVADPDRADDIVQQTWMASIERPPIPGLPARAWLASVVRNAARHVVRSDRRRRRAEANLTPRPPAPSTADVVAREAIRAAIVRAVLDLAEPYREAVLLRYFEGLPPRAIARQLRVPVETVRTRLKRAHALLREHLDREHGDRRAWVLTVLPLARLGAPTGGLASASPIIIIVLVGLVAALLAMLQWGVLPIAPGIGPPSTSDGSIIGGPAGFSTHPTDATASSDRGPTTPPTVRRPTITGHLVDRGGRPVPGASVRSFPSTATSLFETTGPGVPFTDSTESDEQGRFTVALDPTEPFGAIFVEKSGFSPAAVGELRPADDVVVTLDSPWTLTGTVRDGDDRPVAGARVRWRRILLLCRIERVAQSDANGTFRLEGLPASEPAAALGDAWAIDVDADGFAPLHVESNPSRLHEPPVEHLDLVLGAGATLSGRVLDDQSGEAIVGAEVSLHSVEGNPTAVSRDTGLVVVEPSFGRKLASVVSGPDGAYRIDHVPARGFHDPSCFLQDDAGSLIAYVRVEAPGVSNRVFPVRVSDEGATVTQDLRCARAATIVGRVVDERGRPVRGATMSARDHFSDHLGVWGSNPGTTTAEDGRYTLERVAASDHVSVHARLGAESASGYVDVDVRAGAVAEAPDIVFGSSLVANLVVVDSGGRPVWGAVAVSGYRMGVETRADEHGRLRLFFPHASGTAPRRVTVRAPGLATTLSPELSPSAESSPEVRVVLEPAHRISGRVIDAAGLSVSRALVTVSLEASLAPPGGELFQLAIASVRTGDDGTFELHDLPSGPYRVHVEWQPPIRVNYSPPALEADLEFVATNATGLVISLPPRPATGVETAPLEGTVRDAATRRPILRFGALVDLGGNAIWAKRVGPGRFRFDEVPLGEDYRVRVIAEGYAPWDRAGVDVRAPGERPEPIDALLERGATVSGTVGGLASSELGSHLFTLRFEGSGSNPFQGFRVGRDGRYEAIGIAPGRYRPVLTSPSLQWQTFVPDSNAELDVLDASTPVRFDFDVVRAGTVTIGVDSSLSPESARWQIRDRSGALVRERRDATQSWDLDLPPGDYVFRIDWSDGRPLEQDVHVVAGNREQIWLPRR